MKNRQIVPIVIGALLLFLNACGEESKGAKSAEDTNKRAKTGLLIAVGKVKERNVSVPVTSKICIIPPVVEGGPSDGDCVNPELKGTKYHIERVIEGSFESRDIIVLNQAQFGQIPIDEPSSIGAMEDDGDGENPSICELGPEVGELHLLVLRADEWLPDSTFESLLSQLVDENNQYLEKFCIPDEVIPNQSTEE